MPIFYVRSTDGSDGDNGTTWALAKATLAGAFAVAAAGDTIFVSQNHAETQASVMTLTSPGTPAAPCRVLCGNDAAEPPTTLATTATISTTGANRIQNAGHAYIYGITFNVQTSGFVEYRFITTDFGWWFDTCTISLGSTTGLWNISSAAGGTGTLVFTNCTIDFSGTAQELRPNCTSFVMRDCIFSGADLTNLFDVTQDAEAIVHLLGCDLSSITGTLIDASDTTFSSFLLENCKLGVGVTISSGTIPSNDAARIRFVNCDSADTNYRYYKQNFQGEIFHETTIVRTGGASDGTTPISRKMVSSANPEFFSPLESDPCVVWNETTGSSVTATIEIITDNVTLQDDEVWIEVEYFGTSGFPLSLFASDRAADILATPANQASSSVAWTTTGLSTPLKQKLSVAFTPQEKGPIKVRVMLAKVSTTMYFNPKIDIS